jgi:DNA polymerase-3 subunit gamma/tau
MEKVKIEKEALEMIAIAAEGGMRDAESLFSQVLSLEDKNITSKEVEEILGTTDRKFAYELADLIFQKKSGAAVSKVNGLSEDGYDLEIFAKNFLNFLRQMMLIKIDPELKKHFVWEMPKEEIQKISDLAEKAELSDIISTINLFLEAKEKISRAIIPQLPLEIAIIKATRTFPAPEKEESVSPASSGLPHKITAQSRGGQPEPCPPLAKQQTDTAQSSDKVYDADSENPTLQQIKENWPKLLQDIKPLNHSLSILLLTCQIKGVLKNIVSLATPYEFYAERLSEAKNKLTIEEVFSNICGSKVTLNISIDNNLVPSEKEENPPPPEKSGTQDSLLTDALEIMGGKVVKE